LKNNAQNIVLTHNGLKRITIFSITEIFDWLQENPRKTYWEYGNYRIKMKRAKVFFKKGLICVSCGTRGEFFALEKDRGGGIHLDLYGYIDKDEVLMTIDHIIPKSKGGLNKLINFQPMCKLCNELKSDEI
jgi:5-methylcytosine-specific restriction endonuclease McrA